MPASTRDSVPTRPRFASMERLAAEWDLSPRTIRSWISQGLLGAYHVGGRLIRIDVEEFETLVSRRIPTAAVGPGRPQSTRTKGRSQTSRTKVTRARAPSDEAA